MSVTRSEVEHIARLAALAIDEQSLPALTAQIGRILEYVSQLEVVQGPVEGVPSGADYPGPHQQLRADEAHRTTLALPLQAIAPALRDGLFLVPRLGSLENDE